jgi:hypothetical protein
MFSVMLHLDEKTRFVSDLDAAIKLLRDKDARLLPMWTRIENTLVELRAACAMAEPEAPRSDESKAGILVVARDTLSVALAELSAEDNPPTAPVVLALASLHQRIVARLT